MAMRIELDGVGSGINENIENQSERIFAQTYLQYGVPGHSIFITINIIATNVIEPF